LKTLSKRRKAEIPGGKKKITQYTVTGSKVRHGVKSRTKRNECGLHKQDLRERIPCHGGRQRALERLAERGTRGNRGRRTSPDNLKGKGAGRFSETLGREKSSRTEGTA